MSIWIPLLEKLLLCAGESRVTMPCQLIFLRVELCRPLETLQNLKVASTWKTFILKHGLLILFLLTSVHQWYCLCQRWPHGFEDKGDGTTWIQLKSWSRLEFLVTGLPVCQGERWVLRFLALCLYESFLFSELVANRMKSCLSIKDDLRSISKPFHNFNFYFKSNNFNLLVEIYLWADFFGRVMFGFISIAVQDIPINVCMTNEWET